MLLRSVPATLPLALERAAEVGAGRQDLGFFSRSEGEERYSWKAILDRSQLIAAHLRERGVKRGDRILIILPTGIDFIASFFAIQILGAIPAPIYPPLRLGRLDEWYERTARSLQCVSAALLLSDRRIQHLLGQVLKRYMPPLGLWLVEAADETLIYHTGFQRSGAEDLALIQFSSGTTAASKPVALRHRQILANVASILDRFDDYHPKTGEELQHALVSWLPLYHDMGLIGALFTALTAVGQVTFIRPEDFLLKPSLWLRALSRFRATVTLAPNFAYNLCSEKIKDEELEGCDLSSLQYALNGAEYISLPTLQRFSLRFAAWGFQAEAFVPVYGLSEASLGVTFAHKRGPQHWGQWFDRWTLSLDMAEAAEAPQTDSEREDRVFLVSCGTPLKNTAVRVVDAEGDCLDEGTVGSLQISGAGVMDGYFGDQDSRHSPQKWLDTGDRGFLWKGDLYITGRQRDIIIVRGRNLAPEDFESCLAGVEGVRKGCAVAVGRRGAEREEIYLFVETYLRDADLRQSLIEDCHREIVARLHIKIDEVLLLAPQTLPRTSSGKLRRAETLRLWEKGILTAPPTATPLWMARELMRNKVAQWQANITRF